MGSSGFEFFINFFKMGFILLLLFSFVPIMIWMEGVGSNIAKKRFESESFRFIEFIQALREALKKPIREEFRIPKNNTLFYFIAPVVALIPGVLAMGAIPISAPFSLVWNEQKYGFIFQSLNIKYGIIFVLAISFLSIYTFLFIDWGDDENKSTFWSFRVAVQMISYELILGLSLIGVLLIYGTFNFSEMIQTQQGPLRFMFSGKQIVIPFLPNWGIFYQPFGFVLFLAATICKTHRRYLDNPSRENRCPVGYSKKYQGIRLLMIYFGEYGHMIVGSALISTLFFGGWNLPFGSLFIARLFSSEIIFSLVMLIVFFGKVFFFLWIFIWIRSLIPVLSYEKTLNFGWRVMVPWSLLNIVLTAFFVLVSHDVGI